MRREDLKPAIFVAAYVLALGFILTALAIASMRAAYHRAYTEIASSCRRMSLLTVADARYFCAPVAGVEVASPARPGIPTAPVTKL
jgi:hypothetical protein